MKNLSRRDALMRGGGAAVAGTTLAIFPAAAKSEADAELLRLGAEWRQARKEVAQASAEMDALEKRLPARLEPPRRIRAHNGHVLTEPEIRAASWWTKFGHMSPVSRPDLPQESWDWLKGERRKLEQDIALLRAYKTENAAHIATFKRLGIPAAEARWNAALDRALATEDKIIAVPAYTLAGLAIKLRVAENDIRKNTDHNDGLIPTIVEDGLRLAAAA